ncbi:hypothetical protein A6A19_03285 [Actinobacillus delphinicola]|uniref:hypothetical protein n=1 Tax=Actinobacillus delphinicola TaxID=51161 RepID=UPI0024428449|nr:hypothetical protein [Actinobacillus delphinicola]MDG6897047.1 hypothetical protein [Actinobacillus delphinicola]
MKKRILKEKLVKSLLSRKIEEFYRDESGVYGMITVLLSAVIIGYVTFVVDGTGILFDKVRFTQGLQQAGLFLTAEDNRFRDNQNIVGINSQLGLGDANKPLPPKPGPFTQQPPTQPVAPTAPVAPQRPDREQVCDAAGYDYYSHACHRAYREAERNYEDQVDDYRQKWQDYQDAMNTYHDEVDQYNAAEQQYEQAKADYKQQVDAYNSAVNAKNIIAQNFKNFELHAKNVGIPLKGCSESKTDPTAYKQCDLEFKEYERNIQMVASVVRSYYLPDTYKDYTSTGNAGNNYNIKDDFYYHCDHVLRNGVLTNDIACVVDGGFERPSWLFWGNDFKKDYGLSFGRTQKIAVDNTVYIGKYRANIPVDIMFVADFSSSMMDGIDGRPAKDLSPDDPDVKINVLRSVIKKVSTSLLKPSSDPNAPKVYNRIGFALFGYGSQLYKDSQQCALPYIYNKTQLDTPVYIGDPRNKDFCDRATQQTADQQSSIQNDQTQIKQLQQNIQDVNGRIPAEQQKVNQCQMDWTTGCNDAYDNLDNDQNKLQDLQDQLTDTQDTLTNDQNTLKTLQAQQKQMCIYKTDSYDLDYFKTLDMVDHFDGSPLTSQKSFYKFNKNMYCLHQRDKDPQPSTTQVWYTSTNADLDKLNADFENIAPQGATLASSGLMIGANLLMQEDKTALPDKIKSNTKRFIVVLSDGIDTTPQGTLRRTMLPVAGGEESKQYNSDQVPVNVDGTLVPYGYSSRRRGHLPAYHNYITRSLMDPAKYLRSQSNGVQGQGQEEMGLCDRIRRRLDSLQQDGYTKYNSKISFIAVGYDPRQAKDTDTREQTAAWQKCVGEGNYYTAKSADELANAIRSATGLNNEVGQITDKRPVFNNNTDPLTNSPVLGSPSSSSSSGLPVPSDSGTSSSNGSTSSSSTGSATGTTSSSTAPDGSTPPGQGSSFDPAGVSPP